MATDLIFTALADPRRRAILEYLAAEPRMAGEIADRFDVSWPAVSRHLRLLREAGLVAEQRQGRGRQYTINSGRLAETVRGWVNRVAPATLAARLPIPSSAAAQMGREYVS